MKSAQEEVGAKAASHVHCEKPYQYKKMAHKEQSTFNDKLTNAINDVCATLEEAVNSQVLSSAKAALAPQAH